MPNKQNKNLNPGRKSKQTKSVAPRPKQPQVPGTVIKHTELIASITLPNSSFSLVGKTNGYAVNAGSRFTFPWLSSIARNFEKFQVRRLSFHAKTSSPSTYGGNVYLALDTDPLDTPPGSSAEFMANKFHAIGQISKDVVLNLSPQDCKLLHSPYGVAYTKARDGADPPGRSSTIGRLFVGSQASQASYANLYVSYEIVLLTPQLSTTTATTSQLALYQQSFSDSVPVALTPSSLSLPTPLVSTSMNSLPAVGLDITKLHSKLFDFGLKLSDATETVATGSIMDGSAQSFKLLDENQNELFGFTSSSPSNDGMLNAVQFSTLDEEAPSCTDGFLYTFSLEKILEAFPLTKYLVPMLVAATAGAYTPSIRVHTDL